MEETMTGTSFWLFLLVGTAGIVVFSWFMSIKDRRYHGIPRFFAFESLLALFLHNVPYWFRNPFSVPQILSWILLAGSLVLVLHGSWLLVRLGRPEGHPENTTRLVETGAYRYIRHPLYGSLFLLGLGIFFKRMTAVTAALAAVDAVAVYLTARMEEREMIARFGEAYVAYRKRTKMFIPFVF
jgi:protein-S-isoprenylcysteine O-methyltransferase Ste14